MKIPCLILIRWRLWPLWVGSIFLPFASFSWVFAQEAPSNPPFRIEFKEKPQKAQSLTHAQIPASPSRPFVVFGMDLNQFLATMAQRAHLNYTPRPDITGWVEGSYWQTDALAMAQEAARAHGYVVRVEAGNLCVDRYGAFAETPKPEISLPPTLPRPSEGAPIIPRSEAKGEAASSSSDKHDIKKKTELAASQKSSSQGLPAVSANSRSSAKQKDVSVKKEEQKKPSPKEEKQTKASKEPKKPRWIPVLYNGRIYYLPARK